MAIDPRYLMSPSLQQYFVDKDTGFPLAAGEVFFFEDNNRSQPKSVFKISGSPPNYSFVDIGNKITLSSVGTMADDNGNDFIPYVLPEDSEGNLQFYYVEIYSAGGPTDGVLQFTREAWPPEAATSSGNQTQDSTLNLIPNGQFATHNNIPADIVTGMPTGRITAAITDVAPGGWTFERPSTSAAIDSITFTRFPAFTDNPTGSPRYEILIQSNGGSPSDSFKDLRKKFNDVNKFASDTQQYTIFFSARSTTGNSFVVSLNLIKNYGTGGDPEEVINIDDFTITPAQQNFSVSFVWGSNVGKTIGPNNDDFCQLAFSCPTGITFGTAMTDFVDLIGEINITQFPITTDEDFVDRSLVPPIPGFNRETWGLPIISTSRGLDYDYSQVGIVSPTLQFSAPTGYLRLVGQTIRTDSFFSDGVPCSRLRNAIMDNTTFNTNIPMYGTGKGYVTSYRSAGFNPFFISANDVGISSPVSDGAVPTGFTFVRIATGVANIGVYNLLSYPQEAIDSFWVESIVAGTTSHSSSSAGSNIFVRGNAQTNVFEPDLAYCDVNIGERYGTSNVKMLILPTVSALPSPSSYIRIRLPSTVNDIVAWFNIDGVGVQPVVPGINTYIRINLTSQLSNIDVAYILPRALSGAEIGYVLPLNGASITPNSYFNFFVGIQQYYVWYNLNGLGTDPNVPGAIGIPVIYTTANTVQDISFISASAINRMFYGLPDTRGWVIKGVDDSGFNLYDNRTLFRFRINGDRHNPFLLSTVAYPGSYQYESELSGVVSNRGSTPIGAVDIYPTYPDPGSFVTNGGTRPPPINSTAFYAGTSQLDVKNIYFNYIVKY